MRLCLFWIIALSLCTSPVLYGEGLEEAIQKAVQEEIQQFLKTATIKQQNEAVCNAIEREDAISVQTLSQSGAECTIQYSKIPSLIQQGKEKGLALLENYAQNPKEAKGQILWYGISLGRPHIISTQIAKGVDLDHILEEKKLSYLMFAANSSSAEIISLLLRGGATVNLQNMDQKTALHFAAGQDFESVELLIQKGADINAADKKGLRPIDLALVRNKVEIFRLLQGEGARPPQQKTMRQAVRLILMFERHEMANLLVEYYPKSLDRLPASQQDAFLNFLESQPTP